MSLQIYKKLFPRTVKEQLRITRNKNVQLKTYNNNNIIRHMKKYSIIINKIFVYMTLRSNFLSNRINFILRHKLLPCLQERPLQLYWKMFIHTTDGIAMENFILYNIMCVI